MFPLLHNGMSWGLGPPNLDIVFSSLELEVRNSIDEITNLDEGIDSLEKELGVALKQRDNALLALANASLEPTQGDLDDNQEQVLQVAESPPVLLAVTSATAAVGQLEHHTPAEVHQGDVGQALHIRDEGDQVQPREAVDRAPDEPARPDEPTPPEPAASVPLLPPTALREDTVMEEARPPLSADDIKKRLLQVLRHLRDTAACCRQIPDLDRGFSNMLKSTYKTLYDSLKEVTSKGGASRPAAPSPASAATATGASMASATATTTTIGGGRSSTNPKGRNSSSLAAAATKAAAAATQTAADPAAGTSAEPAAGGAGGGASAPPAPATSIARDLSALARLVHAKRLHQQADGGAARDADQAPARRPVRAPPPHATSASGGSRLPALYDGLPPVRVMAAPGHATPIGPAAEAGVQAAEPAPAGPGAATVGGRREPCPQADHLGEAAGTTIDVCRGREPVALSSSPRNVALAEGSPVRGTAARQGAGAGCGGVCSGGGGGAQGEASPSRGGGGSPSQQLMDQARASGVGVARSLLLQTAQPAVLIEALSPSQGGNLPAGQQRAKRALDLEAGAGQVGLSEPAPASASKRQHTGI